MQDHKSLGFFQQFSREALKHKMKAWLVIKLGINVKHKCHLTLNMHKPPKCLEKGNGRYSKTIQSKSDMNNAAGLRRVTGETPVPYKIMNARQVRDTHPFLANVSYWR